METKPKEQFEPVSIPSQGLLLAGELAVPVHSVGIVIFAHGSGSSRHSPRNQFVARCLRDRNLGTLLFDLLTPDEGREDQLTGHLRFNIELLAQRLLDATRWFLQIHPRLPIGYFGASTGGGAALVAAADLDDAIAAVVSRGGRPDLAGDALPRVKSPTLLIVGGNDLQVVKLNEAACQQMNCPRELRLISGATHLFEEPGTLSQAAQLAANWFDCHFTTRIE